MSTKLPQATQTKKLKTLPKELRGVADKLIKSKFGKEVVEQQAHDPFRQEYPDHVGRDLRVVHESYTPPDRRSLRDNRRGSAPGSKYWGGVAYIDPLLYADRKQVEHEISISLYSERSAGLRSYIFRSKVRFYSVDSGDYRIVGAQMEIAESMLSDPTFHISKVVHWMYDRMSEELQSTNRFWVVR